MPEQRTKSTKPLAKSLGESKSGKKKNKNKKSGPCAGRTEEKNEKDGSQTEEH